MNPRSNALPLFVLITLGLGLIVSGCASHKTPATRGKVMPWTTKIIKVTPASVEVDLIGINKSEDDYWRNSVNMDEYWKPGSPVRQAAFERERAVATRFENSRTFVLDRTDPIWKTWSKYGTYELLVLANLPGSHHSGSDPRRLFLPLGKDEWMAKHSTLELEILENQIRVLTPPKP